MADAFLPGGIEQRGEIVYHPRSRILNDGKCSFATGLNSKPVVGTGGVS